MKTNLIVMIFIVAILVPLKAFSQDESDWDFSLAPFYLWAISIDGDLGIRERTVDASIDFGDVWDNLDAVLTFRFNTLYRNKFGFMIDYNYLDLGSETETDNVNIEAGFKSQIVNLGGTYRLKSGINTWDLLAGARYTHLEADIRLRNLGADVGGDQDWVDPIVGVRYLRHINDNWSVRLYGDIGGFGVSSDFTWQAFGLVDFHPWEHVAIVAGYRAIYTDYETGSGADQFSYDATVHGPIAGIDISW